uniref:Uncharacterized protein n=1 Tax=Panagrolaimus sp. PS1159 TaxID=55785 RepID=A0AC35EVY9_9BILA
MQAMASESSDIHSNAAFLQPTDSVINCEGKNEKNDLFCNYGSRHYCLCHHYPNGFKFLRNTCEHVELPFPQYRINIKMTIKITGNITHSKLEEKIRHDLNRFVGVPLNEWNGVYMVTFIRKKCNKAIQNQIDVYSNIYEPRSDVGIVLNVTKMLKDIVGKEKNGIQILSAHKIETDRIPRVFAIKHFAPMKVKNIDIQRLNNHERPNNGRNFMIFLTQYHIAEIFLIGVALFMNGYIFIKLAKYYNEGKIRFKSIGEPGVLIITK